ncbi:unnamed protein product [Calypogeia fissa]
MPAPNPAPSVPNSNPPPWDGVPIHNSLEEDSDKDDDDALEDSPNVDPPDLDLVHYELETKVVELAFGRVDILLENIQATHPTTPINVSTQTPEQMVPQDENAPMLVESEGEQSEYEAHFSQSMAKGEKACKQANRTPKADASAAITLGKKQRKQLHFPHPSPPLNGCKGDSRDMVPNSTQDDSRKNNPALKKNSASRAEGTQLLHNKASTNDKQKGKEAASTHSPGK